MTVGEKEHLSDSKDVLGVMCEHGVVCGRAVRTVIVAKTAWWENRRWYVRADGLVGDWARVKGGVGETRAGCRGVSFVLEAHMDGLAVGAWVVRLEGGGAVGVSVLRRVEGRGDVGMVGGALRLARWVGGLEELRRVVGVGRGVARPLGWRQIGALSRRGGRKCGAGRLMCGWCARDEGVGLEGGEEERLKDERERDWNGMRDGCWETGVLRALVCQWVGVSRKPEERARDAVLGEGGGGREEGGLACGGEEVCEWYVIGIGAAAREDGGGLGVRSRGGERAEGVGGRGVMSCLPGPVMWRGACIGELVGSRSGSGVIGVGRDEISADVGPGDAAMVAKGGWRSWVEGVSRRVLRGGESRSSGSFEAGDGIVWGGRAVFWWLGGQERDQVSGDCVGGSDGVGVGEGSDCVVLSVVQESLWGVREGVDAKRTWGILQSAVLSVGGLRMGAIIDVDTAVAGREVLMAYSLAGDGRVVSINVVFVEGAIEMLDAIQIRAVYADYSVGGDWHVWKYCRGARNVAAESVGSAMRLSKYRKLATEKDIRLAWLESACQLKKAPNFTMSLLSWLLSRDGYRVYVRFTSSLLLLSHMNFARQAPPDPDTESGVAALFGMSDADECLNSGMLYIIDALRECLSLLVTELVDILAEGRISYAEEAKKPHSLESRTNPTEHEMTIS
ncbi:hypothetical protein Tco_0396108 [Tanacetum coccineum]